MKPLRVLMVEDSPDDALLVTLELRRGGYAPEVRRVESAEALSAALEERWDVVISDYAMPAFDGLSALRLVRQRRPELPFVLVSGTIGEERAVEALKSGAGDFVAKQNLSRLVPAIERELRDAAMRRDRRDTLEKLEAAVEARDQFLSIASHELKTPLTALQLQLQSLARAVEAGDGGGERLGHKLRMVTRSTERLGELVNRLLDVSRVGEGPLDLVREEMDLGDLVEEVAARFADAAREAGSSLELTVRRPVRGRWDRLRLETVVVNLLSNAVKYGSGQQIAVAVRTAEGRAVVEVSDRGIGIDPSDQARIFERYGRAVPERHYGGFGVGLWVSRLVAEAHGGRLEVQSAPGRGATFTLELPLQEPTS
ncbi:MAG TPA: hybrid sensor histidine kinase/response regulator [Anaeromyxobacteraceae bacterium]|nr:hybrid sensor histidine kinase/response regulator [Anaeromyxobacteraceae bacterium]